MLTLLGLIPGFAPLIARAQALLPRIEAVIAKIEADVAAVEAQANAGLGVTAPTA